MLFRKKQIGIIMFKIVASLFITTLLTLSATPLLKTGQTQSYDTDGNPVTDGSIEDDGFYQAGATRSYSRSGDVVTDNVTGLQWQDNESVTKPWVTQANYDAGNYDDTSGDTATTYCSSLSLDGGGWRLPTIEELETIVDDGRYNPATTGGRYSAENLEGVFHFISLSYCWSSTSHASSSSNAWSVDFYNGNSYYYDKSYYNYVRCVRGGQ